MDPSSVWLKDDIDDTGYFPVDDDGHFRLQDNSRVLPYCTLLVEGPEQVSATRSTMAMSSTNFNSPASSSHLPQYTSSGFRSVLYSHKKIRSFNVKITKAILHKKGRKPEFTATGQLYIEMLESNSNIQYALEAIRNKWGPDYILVSSDGLKIEDSAATRGIAIVY